MVDIPFAETGEFVYHCHILEHEDAGMMAKIRGGARTPLNRSACKEQLWPVADYSHSCTRRCAVPPGLRCSYSQIILAGGDGDVSAAELIDWVLPVLSSLPRGDVVRLRDHGREPRMPDGTGAEAAGDLPISPCAAPCRAARRETAAHPARPPAVRPDPAQRRMRHR